MTIVLFVVAIALAYLVGLIVPSGMRRGRRRDNRIQVRELPGAERAMVLQAPAETQGPACGGTGDGPCCEACRELYEPCECCAHEPASNHWS